MNNTAIVIVVVAASVVAILLVIAPWRSIRRDALDEADYYALLAGEEPPEPDEEPGSDEESPSGPSIGDIPIP